MANNKQSTPKQDKPFQMQFLCPRYWGIWLGVFLLRLFSLIPHRAKYPAGKLWGKVIYILGRRRRRIARANIEIAYPDKSEQEREVLLHKHFESLGIAFMEMSIAWYGDHRRSYTDAFERKIVKMTGEDNLRAAMAKGKGVLVLAPHFTTLELASLFVSFFGHYYAVYRPHNNPLIDYLIAHGRSVTFEDGSQSEPVANSDTRKMLKVLRAGHNMFFLPDQRYRARGSIMVPFFGKECPSNPATSKIAKITGCAVVPTMTRRVETKDNVYYEVEYFPALENFPSGDDYEDTLRLHHIYEEMIAKAPEQYLWSHNRWNLKDLRN